MITSYCVPDTLRGALINYYFYFKYLSGAYEGNDVNRPGGSSLCEAWGFEGCKKTQFV